MSIAGRGDRSRRHRRRIGSTAPGGNGADFDGATFAPRSAVRRMDHGAHSPGATFYAGQTFLGDPRGRVVQTAWQPGNRGATWTGLGVHTSTPGDAFYLCTTSGTDFTYSGDVAAATFQNVLIH